MWHDFVNDGICIVRQIVLLQTDQGNIVLIGFTNHVQSPPKEYGKLWYQTLAKFLSEHT